MLFNNIIDKLRKNILVNTDHGLMIVNRFDGNQQGVGQGHFLLNHGNSCSLEATVCSSIIDKIEDPVIFDIGANIGSFTTLMAKRFSLGKIYSFEPQRQVFQMLCGNVSINNFDNVYTHNLALGKNNSYIEFEEPDYFRNQDYGTFNLTEPVLNTVTNNKIVVQLQTLDSFIEIHKIKKINLLKIDVEGMEMDVLNGGIQTIETHHPVIFIEYNNYRKSILDDIQDFLIKYNYSFQLIDNNLLAI